MEMEVSTPDFVLALQNMIKNFLEAHPNVSLNALSSRSLVPISTLRRLSLGLQKSEIAPHTVLNLASYIYKEKNLQKLIQKVDPSLQDFLQKNFGQFIFSSPERIFSTDLNRELSDQIKYFIYKLAANHNGTSFKEILELYGRLGESKLVEMIESGLIIETEDQFHAKDKNFSLDANTMCSHLPAIVSLFKPQSVSAGLNLVYSLSEALSPEAIQEIKRIQKEAVQKIHDIMTDEKNFGEIPYFTINMAETFTLTTPEKQNEKNYDHPLFRPDLLRESCLH